MTSPTLFPREHSLPEQPYVALAIARIASEIRRASDQVDRIPFDPWRAASACGFDIRLVPHRSPFSGRVFLVQNRVTIELRSGEPHRRQRFTLCHELAHVCFIEAGLYVGENYSVRQASSAASKLEERICDRIAATLLMPEAAFLGKARTLHTADIPHVTEFTLMRLADQFQVSVLAVRRRARELKLWKSRMMPSAADLSSFTSASSAVSRTVAVR